MVVEEEEEGMAVVGLLMVTGRQCRSIRALRPIAVVSVELPSERVSGRRERERETRRGSKLEQPPAAQTNNEGGCITSFETISATALSCCTSYLRAPPFIRLQSAFAIAPEDLAMRIHCTQLA